MSFFFSNLKNDRFVSGSFAIAFVSFVMMVESVSVFAADQGRVLDRGRNDVA